MSSKILLICIILFTVFTFSDSIPLKEPDYPENKSITSPDFPNEQILSDTENAYNPIPSPDGKLIAYVETGWDRYINLTGLGRGNLQSNIKLMDSNGIILTEQPLADAFLDRWTSDGKNLVAFRDWKYLIISGENGSIIQKAAPDPSIIPNFSAKTSDHLTDASERFAYLEQENTFIWIQNEYKAHRNKEPGSYYTTLINSTFKTSQNDSLPYKGFIPADNILIPSPNGQYIAIIGFDPKSESNLLKIYNRDTKTWTNLGNIYIHPDKNWDYIKPSWSPWFADSSKLVFVSTDGIVVSSPDGKDKKIIIKNTGNVGIPVPSSNGGNIAYVSFEPRPIERRPDLKFYGGTIIWVVDTEGKTEPQAVTNKNEDETYCLRWLNNQQIIFDRVADENYFKKARLWKANVLTQTK